VPVQLLATGNENALGFSLNFDSSLLAFTDVALGADVPAGSSLIVNSNLADSGKVGVAVALAAGASFNAGTQEVIVVRFSVASVANPVTIPVTFGDQPTTRQLSDAQAHVLPAVFVPANVTIAASPVRVVSVTASSGGEASVPVQLVAQGNENALGFSLNFDSSVLALTEVSLGADVPAGSSLVINTNAAGTGKVGVAVALAAGTAFTAGAQEVAVIRFAVAPVLNAVTIPITFGDTPTTRQLSDRQAHVLPSVFVPGSVAIVEVQFEGDMAPRPDGDRTLTIIDWVQSARFVAGLDVVDTPGEFQRVDCAPRASRGNGAITVSDLVQAGRYAVGLDPLTPVGGPTSAEGGGGGAFQPAGVGTRTLCVVNTSIAQGLTNVVPVTLEASGKENALGFSLTFDATKLRFAAAVPGAGASGATLTVNANQADAGRIGIVLALPPGSTLPAGTLEVVKVSLAALATAPASVTVSFGDQPVTREVSDSGAQALSTTYTSGTVSVTPPPGPPLRLTRSGNMLFITWPSTPTGFALEATTGGLGTAWNLVSGVIDLGDEKQAIVTMSETEKYFRLKK
jgi:hypothetical protein